MGASTRVGVVCALAVAALGAVGAASACDLTADPAVIVEVSGGNATKVGAEDCANGLRRYVVDEGSSITLTAHAADAPGCDTIAWTDVIEGRNNNGGKYKMSELFDASGFIQFITPQPGTQSENFSWSLQDNAGILAGTGVPTSGDYATFEVFVQRLLGIGAVPGSNDKITLTGGPNPQGFLKVNDQDLRIYWSMQPATVPAFYGVTVDQNVGLNPDFPEGTDRQTTAGQPITFTFDTPSFSNAEGYDAGKWYAVYVEAALPFEFEPGASFKASATRCTVTTPSVGCDPSIPIKSGDIIVNLQGKIIRRSTEGVKTRGEDGHPSLTLIAVKDKTQMLGGKITPDGAMGEADAGAPVGTGTVTVSAVDNNPWGKPADYQAHAWALVERSYWQGGDLPSGGSTIGDYHDDAAHAHHGDDCWAANPGHQFRWLDLGTQPASAVSQLMVSGKPAGLKVDFPAFEFTEPTGTHWARNMTAGGSSVHHDYVADGMKIVWQIEDRANGARPTGVPETAPTLDICESWSGELQEGYKTGGGTVAAPTGTTNPAVDVPALAQGCPECAGFKLVGLPTYEVVDKLPPSLVIYAHDLKYDKTYFFGENFSGDANGNQEYIDAYLGQMQAGDPESPNVARPPYAGNSEWNRNGGDDGYTLQIGGYMSSFFPSCANVESNSGDYAGLWIDEDTRVEFDARGWDNIEGWRRTGVGGGVDSITLSLTDTPSGGSMSGPGTYLFRNPNKPDALRGSLGPAFVEARVCDKSNNCRTVKVQVYIADNSLKIYSLEENRRRLSN